MDNTIKNRNELIRLINMNIGSNIQKRREIQKMTRAVLSKEIGSSIESIRQYELGNNNISAARLFIISLELDVPVDEFFRLDQEIDSRQSEQQKIRHVIRDFFKISTPSLADSIISLIRSLAEEIRSTKEEKK